MPISPPVSPRENEIDLLYLAGMLLDRWKTIATVTVLFMLLALAWALCTTPVWQADALIQVEKNPHAFLPETLRSVFSEQSADIAPEIQLLQSRMVMGKTVRDLKFLQLPEQEAIRQLAKSLTIAEKGKGSGMIGLTMTGSDPALLVTVLNTLIDNYQQQNIVRQAEQESRSLNFLELLLTQVRSKLNDAEAKLNAYRQQHDSVDLNLEAKTALEQLVTLENQLNTLNSQEAEVAQLFKREHPAYQTLQNKRNALIKEKARLSKRVSEMPSVQQEILRLSREVESGRTVYMQLLSRQQELSISHSGVLGNVRIIDKAEVSPDPIKPKKMLIVVLGTMMGFVLSAMGVLAMNLLRQRIDSPRQLEEQGLPVYAIVPRSEWLVRKMRRLKTQTKPFLATDNPSDLSVEAIRNLRTTLRFDMVKSAQGGVLMITCATPNSGKTFISTTLAAVMAQVGKKVLFIDADMRRGDAHTFLGFDRGEGLTALLSGKHQMHEVVRTFHAGGFDVLTRGASQSDPTELLMSERFNQLIAWAEEHYDVVIIDTPPVLAVSDAAIIGRLSDMTLLATRAGLNSVKETRLSLDRLVSEGVTVRGIVLNGMTRRVAGFYRDGYRCEGYRYNAVD